ncbi:hypothetical protein SAMN05660865_01638 [Caloramator fervidus]|uniref:Uncharacterized protein n=1 Tax=Caloramator fervidus TaxID=29344 RepID=A0A1H5X2Z7_9CLOT|nr:hypothetical protein [Caloramator fervidus]SEG05750.1 hypothetical protein SAMN05660865_01638 [Caloramator fervidus]
MVVRVIYAILMLCFFIYLLNKIIRSEKVEFNVLENLLSVAFLPVSIVGFLIGYPIRVYVKDIRR